MNSRYTASNAGAEPPQSPYPVGLTPTSAGSWNQLPRRRRDVVQPPALTTSFNGPQNPGLGAALNVGYTLTPLSTTSLSSPFSQSHSPYLPSPGGAARGSSPMAPRNLSTYTAPYNPQEWGPVGSAVSNVGSAVYSPSNNGHRPSQPPPQQSASDVLPSPPPPYSPPAQHQPSRDSVNQTISPADSTSSAAGTSQYYTPTSATTTVSAETISEPRRPVSRPRPLSMVPASDASSSVQMPFPPPPPGGPSSRPSSRPGSERQRKGFNFPSFGLRSKLSSGAARTDISQSPSPGPQYPTAGVQYAESPLQPPSSKRAASTGAINTSSSSSRATSTSRSGSPPRRSWEPGMPLPPPPPGPPPVARSQSTGRSFDMQPKITAHAASRESNWSAAVMSPHLGTIPPTPADWVDEDSTQNRGGSNSGPQHTDMQNVPREYNESGGDGISESRENLARPRRSSNGGLFRTPAVRDTSARGIRERRLESWHKRQQASDSQSAPSNNSNPWAEAMNQVKPSNLVLSETGKNDERTDSRLSARSAALSSTYSTGSEGAGDTTRAKMSSGLFSSRSSFSTPRQEQSSAMGPQDRFAHTPPFSPHGDLHSPMLPKGSGQAVPPKALPTPPPQSAHDTKSASHFESRPEERPVSHILHLPNDPVMMPQPLSPRRISAEQPAPMDPILKRDDQFVRDAARRHQSFIEKEAAASSESEALRLFTDYIVSESIIRRERYGAAWESANMDIQRVRERLFELPAKPNPSRESSLGRAPSSGRRPSRGEIRIDTPQSRPESAWWANYQPCLSPIASLSMSNDEMSSRGRAPSRWWESKTSSSEGGERKVQRSKRESKYMGLQRELHEAMQWSNGQSIAEAQEEIGNLNQSSPPVTYGPGEYPPEKVGWHEQSSQASTDHASGYPTVEDRKMDISRFITLPPPYPRHYPAVNNSHPDLVTYRTTVRSISDLSEIRTTRERHKAQAEKMQTDHQDKIQQNRRQFRSNVQNEIQKGNITFAEAAQAEASLGDEEKRLEKEMIQNEFDSFQESVLKPMHAILIDRINKATLGIDELKAKLSDVAQHGTPDQAQEEGDEKPELLEMLTQLKWLFEAREQLHREVYDLLSDRNEKYRAVVSLQYRQSKNEEKIRETDAFFIRDAMDRRVQYETATLSRLESFMDVIEENVARGVEIQLSAFWDIAPSLLELLQKFPENLQDLEIQIPASEFEENPSYHEHPLQYLYSLLTHAERSTYQYIESQTNLLCLLHEVKSGVMKANCKLMEAQRIRHGEAESVVQQEMRESRAQEERVLTTDLKDKVSTVEGQWTEALGSQIQELRERVRDLLMAKGGWEEVEQLEGV